MQPPAALSHWVENLPTLKDSLCSLAQVTRTFRRYFQIVIDRWCQMFNFTFMTQETSKKEIMGYILYFRRIYL